MLTRVISLLCLVMLSNTASAKWRKENTVPFYDKSYPYDSYISKLLLDTTIVIRANPNDTTSRGTVIKTFSKDATTDNRLSSGTLVAISAVLPGFGQIYNGSYWKLPLVYGAIGAALYFTIEANNRMVAYDDSYKRLYSEYEKNLKNFNDPNIPANMKPPQPSSSQALAERTRRDLARKDRDERVILVVVAYALSLIDVYVDAQLRSFEVGDVKQKQSSISVPDQNPDLLNVSFLNLKIRF